MALHIYDLFNCYFCVVNFNKIRPTLYEKPTVFMNGTQKKIFSHSRKYIR